MTRRRVLVGAMVVVLLLTACGPGEQAGGGRQEPADTPTVAVAKPTATVEPTVEPEPTTTTEPTAVPTATTEPTTNPPPTPTGEPTKVSLGEEAEEALESAVLLTMELDYVPGLAVGVVKNGQIAYAKGFGVLNVETGDLVERTTVFRTGHISQLLVATAIMQLVERGEIDLDAPVVEYLPDFELADERYRDITIRHLLTYASGIPILDDLGFDDPEYDDGSLERFVRSLSNVQLVSEPGQSMLGTSFLATVSGNGAFDVLGHVIATVSDQAFEDYMKVNLLDPLGMHDSTFLKPDSSAAPVAAPHIRWLGKVSVDSVYPYSRAHAPSMGLHSNVVDLCRFAMAFLNEGKLGGAEILAPASIKLLGQPGAPTGPGWCILNSHTGLGCFVGEHGHSKIISQWESIAGFRSALVLKPEKSMAVIVLMNIGNPDPFDTVARGVALEIFEAVSEAG